MVPRLAALVDAARAADVPMHLDSQRLQYRGQLVPFGSLARTGAKTPPRRLSDDPGLRAGTLERRFLIRSSRLPDEVIVTKHRYGAFESSDLDLVLRSRGIRTVIMTGVATNVCVETTARQAFLRDYYVVFTSDCTATYSQAEHDATLHNIDSFFGAVVTADEVRAGWPVACARLRARTSNPRRDRQPHRPFRRV